MSDHDYPENEGQKISTPENDDDADAGDAPRMDGPQDPPFAAEEADGNAREDSADAAEEIGMLNDRLLRLAAELENTRRRGEREKREAGQYAIASFARDLVSVADNFERALRAAGVSGEDMPEGRSDAFKGLVDGIQMVEKELLTMLSRHGVRKLEPSGEKFDPNLHQAVANVPSADIPRGHVVDVAQPGFTIGDRVLRAAMVTVSAGPPTQGSAPGGQLDEEV